MAKGTPPLSAMTRLLLFLAALAVASASPLASAQDLWVGPDDEMGDITDGPPVLQGGFEDAATAVGESNLSYRDDLAWGVILWMAENLGPNVPVDPNCPPPDGCPPDDGDDPPAGGDPPSGGDDPPPGGDTPPSGGDTPPSDDGDAEPHTSASSGSAPPPDLTPDDPTATFALGDAAAALRLRDQADRVAEGAIVPGVTIGRGTRVRLVSKRETDQADRAEYQLRLELVGPGRRATPVLVQAGRGALVGRVARHRPGRR